MRHFSLLALAIDLSSFSRQGVGVGLVVVGWDFVARAGGSVGMCAEKKGRGLPTRA